MKTKNILSITEARSKIFSIVEEIQKSGSHYLLTREGKPEAVIISAKKFEETMGGLSSSPLNYSMPDWPAGFIARDQGAEHYQAGNTHSSTGSILLIRDAQEIAYFGQPSYNKEKKANSLIKAQLYIELVVNYNYPNELIEIGHYLSISRPRQKHYCEADIVVNNQKGSPFLIFAIAPYTNYEKEKNKKIKELFELASILLHQGEKPSWLIYYTHTCPKNKKQEKIMAIDCRQYHSLAEWDKAGKPTKDKIPLFADNNIKEK